MPPVHPVLDENVTVLSGSFAMGMGDKLDATKTKAFPAGSFLVMPGKMNHFAVAKAEFYPNVNLIAFTGCDEAHSVAPTHARLSYGDLLRNSLIRRRRL